MAAAIHANDFDGVDPFRCDLEGYHHHAERARIVALALGIITGIAAVWPAESDEGELNKAVVTAIFAGSAFGAYVTGCLLDCAHLHFLETM